MASKLRRIFIGKARDVADPRTYHTISLIALLAWVGLGADGLSSSAYGPDEAFRALGSHTYLAVTLALGTAFTVLVISIAYSRIIQRFPFGGGGYVVSTELLGPAFGVISGSALLVDYVLTITVSIASGGDQVFSVMPQFAHYKLVVEAVVIGALIMLNLRGVKESVTILAPIFMLFLLTHAILVIGGIGSHVTRVPEVSREVASGFHEGITTLGVAGLFAIFLRAYSMGAGTYTGIEAVSNGIQIMREPKVKTARHTMMYMALSLTFTATGILICYLLFGTHPQAGKTMNAVLLEQFAGGWSIGGIHIGRTFVIVSLAAEALLLFVAAQAGFIDGPRVMSNMARDHWLPHRFVQVSERLTVQNGVMLVGAAALIMLFYTHGDITALVTMYSINVFLTFSLSQAGMIRYWLKHRGPGRASGLVIHGVAFLLCAGILVGVVYEKAAMGGWVTLVITGAVISLCFAVRGHYRSVQQRLRRLDTILDSLPLHHSTEPAPLLQDRPTAVLLVGSYGGLGVHALLTLQRLFPGHYRNVIFASVAVIDAATMHGVAEVDRLREQTVQSLERFVGLARGLGLAAEYRMRVGTEAVSEGEQLCAEIAREYPRAVFFMGTLVFEKEVWYQKLLHNETAFQLQRRLQFNGLNAMVLPVRVLETAA